MAGIDLGFVVSKLGENVVADLGAPLGLDGATSVKLAQAIAANAGKGKAGFAQIAADTGLREEVVSDMSDKLYDKGKEMLLEQSGVAQHAEAAKQAAMNAAQNAAGGLLGKLFGKK